MFHAFKNQDERRAFGGTAFMELQYCKLKQTARIRKILSWRSISNWQNDSLYVHVDDMHCFFSNYADIFGDAVLSNVKGAKGMDPYGVNYFSPAQLTEIICKIEEQQPLEYAVILQWLKQGIDYNGIYILGI